MQVISLPLQENAKGEFCAFNRPTIEFNDQGQI